MEKTAQQIATTGYLAGYMHKEAGSGVGTTTVPAAGKSNIINKRQFAAKSGNEQISHLSKPGGNIPRKVDASTLQEAVKKINKPKTTYDKFWGLFQ